jgi:FlaA1/EpsC-like NDP-sugar epimerase
LTKQTLSRYVFSRPSAWLHDLAWIPFSIGISFWVRFNFETIPHGYQNAMIHLIFIATPIHIAMNWLFGLYKGIWRFASIPDLIRILKAVFVGFLITTVIMAVLYRLAQMPRSVFFLYPIFLVLGLSAPRVFYRWIKTRHLRLPKDKGRRVLIIGAGQAGELLLRDILQNQNFSPVGFLDDDPGRLKKEIHGVKIVGRIDELPVLLKALDVEEVFIAIPSATKNEMQRITNICSEAKIPTRILPFISDLPDSQIGYQSLRPIAIADLLGRDPLVLDDVLIQEYISGKTILVTGGGGSIGAELCRQVAAMNPKQLIILDQSEFNLYTIDYEFRNAQHDFDYISILGDLVDNNLLEWIFNAYKPQIVFHAAAYKHVPMLETNIIEAVKNNIIGTRLVAEKADKFGVKRFVMVSTDKAVNPTNIMGATKRIAEIYCQNFNRRSKTRFITTRFGNVLGSQGSVVPLFQNQIENGGPITVTHPEISRYFMTIPEAVSLILQAGAMGKGGEIYVLDMGEPVKIVDLAEKMIRLSGLTPKKDIDIVYTGLRPGEKLHEELLYTSEKLMETHHPKLHLANSRVVSWEHFIQEMDILKNSMTSRDLFQISRQIRILVPEYQP